MKILCWMISVVRKLNQFKFSLINSRLRRLFISVSIVFFSTLLIGCGSQVESLHISGPMMGTQYNITLSCETDKSAQAWQEELLPIMEAVNQSMSTYLPNSELSKFNQSKSTEFQAASNALIDVFSIAQRVSKETNGAFDVTVNPLVELWGFGSKGNKALSEKVKIPNNAQLSSVQQYIGYTKLELDESLTQWRKTSPKLSVDFSAVAKGYAVDQVSNYLFEQACINHLVDIGGEVRTAGVNAKGNPWRLAIEKPDSKNGFQAVIDVTGAAVASSGDYKNFYVVDGKRYSHMLDPRTLKPIDHNLVAVTVIDPITARADALATAFMVMGKEALDFAEQKKVPALFIFRSIENTSNDTARFQVLYSQAFEKYIVE